MRAGAALAMLAVVVGCGSRVAETGSGGDAGSADASDAGRDGGQVDPWLRTPHEGCLDLTLGRSAEVMANPIRGGTRRSPGSDGILVRLSNASDGRHPLLRQEVFDASTGVELEVRLHDVLPRAGGVWDNGAGVSSATWNAGILAAAVGWRWAPELQPVQGVVVRPVPQGLMAPADVPDAPAGFVLLELEIESRVLQIDWDGEAYAVNGFRALDGLTSEAVVARVAPSGEVILPFTAYGGIVRGGSGEYMDQLSTNAASGITLQFGASGLALLLSGHHRDGTPLACTGLTGQRFAPDDAVIDHPALVAVAATPTGGWVSWLQPGFVLIHEVDLEGCLTGPTYRVPSRPFGDDPTSVELHALWSSGEGFTLVAASEHRLYAWEHDGAALGEVTIVREGNLDPVRGRQGTSTLSLTGYQDERWLTLGEADRIGVLRTLLVKPGCVYPAVVY